MGVFVAGLVGLWQLSRVLEFRWSSHTGIVGWVTAARYPKQQEYFYYWLGVAGIPLLVLGAGYFARDRQPVPPAPPAPRRWPRVVRLLNWLFVGGIVPVLLYLFSYQPRIDGPVDLFHTGEFLEPLNEMLAGAVPYRDVYLQHGLFHNALIPLLGAKVFEPTLAGVRTMQNLVAACFPVAVYLLGLTIFRGRWLTALVAALVVIACGVGGSARLGFGILSLACIAVGWRDSNRWLAAAGLLALLGFWHSVEVGLYALATGVLFLAVAGPWRQRLTRLGWYAGGAFVGFWVIGWFFLWHGALPDLARNIFAQCAYQSETWGRAFPKLPALAALGTWAAKDPIHWYLAPLMFCLCGGWLAWRAGRGGFWESRAAGRLLLLTIAGALFFRTSLGRADREHLYTGTFFAVLLAVFVADQLLGAAWDRRRTRRWRAAGLLVTGLGCAVALGWYANVVHKGPVRLTREWNKLQQWPARTIATNEPIARAGIVDLKGQERQLAKVVAAIQERTQPTDRVLEFTFHPAYLFFANRRSASRYFATCYASLPAMQTHAIAELERHAPPVILSGGGGFDGLTPGARSPLLAAYVAAHYQPVTNKLAGLILLERKTP